MHFVVFLAFFIGLFYKKSVAVNTETQNIDSVVTKFSLKILKKIYEDGKNTFFSGYDIGVALGMVSLGARGTTLSEIENGAHFDDVNRNDSKAIHKLFKTCAETFNKHSNNDRYTLLTVNRLYLQISYKLEKQYQEDIKKFYGRDVQPIDFKSNTAEGVINEWVAKQTNDKIKNIFPKGSFDSNTVLVLVNAIYFKANWNEQFMSDDTGNVMFFKNKTTKVQVNMMSMITDLNYYNDSSLKIQVVELPYLDEYMSMFIFLPEEINGLPALINSLTAVKLESLMNSVLTTYVDLGLPRFRIESDYSLEDVLKKLGIHDLFSSKCDLSAIVSREKIRVSRIRHKTFVQVSEEGTEAAAVTGMSFSLRSKTAKVTVNRPFLFVIRDAAYKIPLFIGAVHDPPTAEKSISFD